jgi:hypothetical protein
MGVLAIPGKGAFIGASRNIAALNGAGVGETVGGIAGGLIRLVIPEIEAQRYEGKVEAGNILISAPTENPEKRSALGVGLHPIARSDVEA